MSTQRETTDVEIDGRTLTLSNQAKVLYPDTGFTKGQVVDYYRRIAPVLIPHLQGKPLTLKRYPNGVKAPFFFEKNATRSRPAWIKVAPIWGHGRGDTLNYLLCDDVPTLVFCANLAGLELHPALSRANELMCPTVAMLDLDPGPPADIVTCCREALVIRGLLTSAGLVGFAKTSGNKGMQLVVPLNTPTTYDTTKAWARALAVELEKRFPDRFVSDMTRALRHNKVFIDWSQNDVNKTTVSVYSLRARERPTVSTPISWEEVEAVAAHGDGSKLVFEADAVLERVARLGDLFGPVLTTTQSLPVIPEPETPKRLRKKRAGL